jgi:hypothetical protein
MAPRRTCTTPGRGWSYGTPTLRLHVYPVFGDRPLASGVPSDVQSLVKRLSGVLAPSTVGVVHRILAAVFKAAVRNRRIVASPAWRPATSS